MASSSGKSPRRAIARATRDSPKIRFKSTPNIAVIAPSATNHATSGTPKARATTSSGAAAVRVASASPRAPT